jgi:septum site-determining protein MinD
MVVAHYRIRVALPLESPDPLFRRFKYRRAATDAVLAVTGGKGGVGKTTTALGLAAAAARAGRRPVVVDADRDCPDLATVSDTDGGGLARLAAGEPLGVAGTLTAGVTVLGARFDTNPGALSSALERLTDTERPVFLDCPAGAGRPAATPLRHAAGSVVVTRRTERALVDGRKTAAMARRLDAAPRGVIVSRVDAAGNVAEMFDVPVLGCVPDVERCSPWRAAESAYDAVYAALA